jgi:ATP-dependent helicase HepA
MQDFTPGQRCISDAELQMGLGTILKVDPRTLTVVFAASGETRTYSRETAPLTRVAFAVGDSIRSQAGVSLTIASVLDSDGLLLYRGRDRSGTQHTIIETELDNFLQLNRPSQRLFNGQIDRHRWFELRYQTLQALNQLGHSELYGLTGCRTSLIPHQLYIAHEVANRYAPRVLLADEVGLGKTIEAGLILHHQLLTERARRVLIVVPESLVHQWLVEMLRRFNLHFRIFDAARLEDMDAEQAGDETDDTESEAADNENPFLSEQLVLCSLEFLTTNNKYFNQCLEGEWDLMVVDEAHHLQWAPDAVSEEYSLIEQLAAKTRGVLLLTATPEQLGKESHFARLRLLDPARFPSFDSFLDEEKSYQPIAQAVQDLLENNPLDAGDLSLIEHTFAEGDNKKLLDAVLHEEAQAINKVADNADNSISAARIELVEHLLDRHGTGRVLFRNTRAAVKGFPERKVFTYPLALPAQYSEAIAAQNPSPALLLTPELVHEALASDERWTMFDPRLDWLGKKLRELQAHKVLVITASAETAMDIAWHLKNRNGIHSAVFHEGLSIVERDRAAAFFADMETGSQVLVCSEIGSEGRNFQFAHHLVLFDLPLNPDLLEQRIGRLDRIGQSETIKLHVPYFEHSAQQVMMRWYHQALQAFEHTCPAGYSVFAKVKPALLTALQTPQEATALEDLISNSSALYHEMSEALHRGRDRLLEFNSCRMHVARALKEKALQADADSRLELYMERVFDCFGVDTEIHSENCFIITPTEHMTNPFPFLAEDGMTITYDRDTALSFEDAHYLTWEHPMVRAAIDMVSTNETGNTALTAIKFRAAPAGSILLEALFTLEAAAVEALQSQRYLPPTTVRVLLDERGNDHNERIKHNAINLAAQDIDRGTAVKIIAAKQKALKAMLAKCEQQAQTQAPAILKNAHTHAKATLSTEINRLKALRPVNPNVREDEIAFFEQQLAALNTLIDASQLRLDALRVIVVT